MSNDNILSIQFKKAVNQSKKLREQALLDNSVQLRLERESKERMEKISNIANTDYIDKKVKKGDTVTFGHIKVKYLKDSKVRVYLHQNNKSTLRLVKGESGDILEVLENHPLSLK